MNQKFKVGDIIRFKGNETLKGETKTHKIAGYDNELYVFDDGTTDLFCEQDLYELVEQKPFDNVKPKFEVGDWIINPKTGNVLQIKNILLCGNKGNYEFDNSSMPIESVDEHYKQWTIQDAKDGMNGISKQRN